MATDVRSRWNEDEVIDWVEGVGLGMYADTFCRKQVTGPRMLELTENELRDEFGMTLGHVMKFVRARALTDENGVHKPRSMSPGPDGHKPTSPAPSARRYSEGKPLPQMAHSFATAAAAAAHTADAEPVAAVPPPHSPIPASSPSSSPTLGRREMPQAQGAVGFTKVERLSRMVGHKPLMLTVSVAGHGSKKILFPLTDHIEASIDLVKKKFHCGQLHLNTEGWGLYAPSKARWLKHGTCLAEYGLLAGDELEFKKNVFDNLVTKMKTLPKDAPPAVAHASRAAAQAVTSAAAPTRASESDVDRLQRTVLSLQRSLEEARREHERLHERLLEKSLPASQAGGVAAGAGAADPNAVAAAAAAAAAAGVSEIALLRQQNDALRKTVDELHDEVSEWMEQSETLEKLGVQAVEEVQLHSLDLARKKDMRIGELERANAETASEARETIAGLQRQLEALRVGDGRSEDLESQLSAQRAASAQTATSLLQQLVERDSRIASLEASLASAPPPSAPVESPQELLKKDVLIAELEQKLQGTATDAAKAQQKLWTKKARVAELEIQLAALKEKELSQQINSAPHASAPSPELAEAVAAAEAAALAKAEALFVGKLKEVRQRMDALSGDLDRVTADRDTARARCEDLEKKMVPLASALRTLMDQTGIKSLKDIHQPAVVSP